MRAKSLVLALLCLLAVGCRVGVPGASAYRQPLVHPGSVGEEWLELGGLPPATEGQIEGACGLAISPSGTLYVSDYYHRAIHSFTLTGTYSGSQFLAGAPRPLQEINTLNSVCGLAVDGTGTIYANEFHQSVMRLPGEEIIDPGQSTGIGIDSAGNLYVDDRTYVAVYDAPVAPGDEPSEKIGTGKLGDAFGLAVDSGSGLVYVADAADQTVKAFDPATPLAGPARTIDGPDGTGFNSLFNASLAIDESPTEGRGHLLVVDDLKPLTQFPEAAVYEFSGDGDYLGRMSTRSVGPTGEKRNGPIFGEPSGIALDPKSGDLFVTTGNGEQSDVVAYGPYEPQAPSAMSIVGARPSTSGGALIERATASNDSPAPIAKAHRKGGSEATIVRRGPVQVSVNGKLTPQRLPRHGSAPVGISIDARISATGSGSPPQLRRISIGINRNGHFLAAGLPACRVDQIQPSTTTGALAACRGSLVGEGYFSADVKLPEQSPFPSEGKVLAFNGRVNGRPAILAHIYGTQPAPTSAVLPFLLSAGHGTYGTTLEASLPQATGDWGYVTGLKMSLRRSFYQHGKTRSYLSAGCPAPSGFPSAVFPLARTSFAFAGGPKLVSVLNRTCTARG